MLKDFFENLLTSGYRYNPDVPEEYETASKIRLSNIISILGLVIAILLGASFYVHNRSVVVLIPVIAFCLPILASVVYLRYTKNVKVVAHVNVIAVIVLITGMLVGEGYNRGGMLLFYAYPLIAFYLLGKQGGIAYTLILFAVFSVLCVLFISGTIPNSHDPVSLIQTYGGSLLLTFLVYIYEDIKEKSQAKITKQAHTDSLTALDNRDKLFVDLAATGEKVATLIVLNIDNFKELNNFYGHKTGDTILLELTGVLKHLLFEEHFTIYRLHADEYGILITRTMTAEEIRKTVKSIHDEIEQHPFMVEGNEINIDVTLGVAQGKGNLPEKADMALKSAKKTKKNYLLYDESMSILEEYEKNFMWMKKLKNAILELNIVPYYQPIVENATGAVVKYESLIRLIDSNKNVVTPAFFLSIAKQSRLYPYLTRIMILKTFDTFKELPYEFSINISTEDILDEKTVDFIKDKVCDYKLANRVVFEILESESIEEYDKVARFIDEMKTLGSRIAIDDFGAGYSNYKHVLNLPIDYIKIDGSLIKSIDTDSISQVVVENIVAFSNKLGIKTIAEFVHSEAVLKKVMALGIDYSQGYFLGKPEAKTLLESHIILPS